MQEAAISRRDRQNLIAKLHEDACSACVQAQEFYLLHVDRHKRDLGVMQSPRNNSQKSHLNIPSPQVAILRCSQQGFVEVCELYSGDAARFV